MKGVNIVVDGSVGHMAAFMGQAGRLVICENAGDALGDSLYEARIYVKGDVASLGADCVQKEMREEHVHELGQLLDTAGINKFHTKMLKMERETSQSFQILGVALRGPYTLQQFSCTTRSTAALQ